MRGLRAVLVAGILARAGAARAQASVVVVDGDVRLRRADVAEARRVGQALPAWGGSIARTALRGETIVFQVVVIAGAVPVRATSIIVPDPVGPVATLHASAFREHYVRVDRRSRNDRTPDESLGWRPGARPPDAAMIGEVPDALLPIAVDPRAVAPPPAVPAGATGAFWVDIEVPEDAVPGRYGGGVGVEGDGGARAHFGIDIDVRPTPLPYRAASVFTYYEPERLPAHFGAAAPAVERQLWQLLHAHHVDGLAELTRASDVDRLASVYDGSLFTEARGYRGPGAGRAPAVVALGAYGSLGAPTPESLARVAALVEGLPVRRELFLYAIDETCKSPRAGDWMRALAAHPPPRPVLVAQTCDDPPGRQAVDIAMLSAFAFERGTPAAARAAGRQAFIYNGVLPRTGTLMLDADPRGLVANGWIAATMAIPRWFYWNAIFWDDDNRGGHGPIDPFATAETFHNADGDSALGDGLLAYPGRSGGRFAGASLGVDAVFPSLRLKAIRRGIQDAGLIALAAREQPEETARLIARALPAALDEAAVGAPPSWERAPLSFAEAREALRALVTWTPPINEGAIPVVFEDLARRRAAAVPVRSSRHPRGLAALVAAGAALLVVMAVGFNARARYSRRARRP